MKIKENIYLLFPIICIGLWAFLVIWDYRLSIIAKGYYHSDIVSFYHAGRAFINDPSKSATYFLPVSNYFFYIAFSIWPFVIAHWISFAQNYIFSVLLIIEFNKILKLKGVEYKIHRTIFLLIASNGWNIYLHFSTNSFKFLNAFIIFFILRREIQWNLENKNKNLKYYITHYGLLLFILAWAPYLIFFFIIYVFYNIPLIELFKKKNVQKYFIITCIFLIQNFWLIIYPNLIFQFLNNFYFSSSSGFMFFLYTRPTSDEKTLSIISATTSIILLFIAIFLAFNRKLSIQQKFTYFSLAYLFLGTFKVYYSTIFLFPLFMLAFIPFLKQELRLVDFFKNNKWVIIGLSSIAAYCLYPTTYGGTVAMIILGIMLSSLLVLHAKVENKLYLFGILITFIIFWTIYTIIIFFFVYLPMY